MFKIVNIKGDAYLFVVNESGVSYLSKLNKERISYLLDLINNINTIETVLSKGDFSLLKVSNSTFVLFDITSGASVKLYRSELMEIRAILKGV